MYLDCVRSLFVGPSFFPMTLIEHLTEYIHACFTGIWIESREHADALAEITTLCRAQQWVLTHLNLEQGLAVAGRNIAETPTNDPLVGQCQQIVGGVSPQDLRHEQPLRQRIATELSAVASNLEGLLVDRPRRRVLRQPR